MHESKEAACELVITGSNATKFLEFEEKTLDKMPLFIFPPVTIPRVGFIGFRRNTEIRIIVRYIFAKFERTIRSICQYSSTF